MLELHTLGDVRLRTAAGDLLAGRRKELALLAYLATRSPRPVRRAELADIFWSDREERRARHSLRQSLLALRRTLGDRLTVGSEAVVLNDGAVVFDLAAFHAAIDCGSFGAAVDLWHGDFLTSMEDAGGESFRAWLEAERERARRRLADALRRLAAHASANGDTRRLLDTLERWTELLPFDEQAHALLIEALHRNGRSGAALARHSEYAALIRRELGAEPSESFQRLATRVAADPDSGPGSVGRMASAALFTPDLVGRDVVRMELHDTWESVRRGGSAVLMVEGAAGMGKTALCEDFLRWAEEAREPVVVLSVRAGEDSVGGGSMASELLSSLLAARGLSGAADEDLGEVAALLPALRERWPHLPAATRDERRLHRALSRVLADVAEEQPIVVCVDEVAYADADCGQLVLALTRHSVPGVLVLLTAGADENGAAAVLAEIRRLPGVRRLKLTALRLGEVEALLASMIEMPPPERRALAQRLHAETGGNPFYAVEVVSALVDDGLLEPDARGMWHPAPSLTEAPLPVPSGVRTAVTRRINALAHPARAVVVAAATLDGRIQARRLGQATGLEQAQVRNALHELIARRFLRTTGTPDTYEFFHPIVRRAAAESAPQPTRHAMPRLSGRRAWLVGAALIALATATVAMMLRTAAPAAPPTVAILHIDASDARSQPEADVLAEMIGTNLTQLPGMQIIGRARIYELQVQLGAAPEGRALLREAAQRAGARELVEGDLDSGAGELRLTLRRFEAAGGRTRSTHGVAAAGLHELADRAAALLATDLGHPAPPLPVDDITTASTAAWIHYDAGLRRFARADYAGALDQFRAALQQDSLFPMAALYAYRAGNALGRSDVFSLPRLDTLASRAAERDRLMIRTLTALPMNEPSSLAYAESLAARHPFEPDGPMLLGVARVIAGDYPGAVAPLRRVLAMDSAGVAHTGDACRTCVALASLTGAYFSLDSLDAVERVASEWIRHQPGSADAWRWLRVARDAQGRFDDADAVTFAAAAASSRDVAGVAAFYRPAGYIKAGDFEAAERSLTDAQRNGLTPDDMLWYRTISLRHQGRLREALEVNAQLDAIYTRAGTSRGSTALQRAQILFELSQFDEAAAIFDSLAANPPQELIGGQLARYKSWMLVHLASARARQVDTASLAMLIEPLRAWGERSAFGRDRRLHHHARGLLLVARGQLDASVDEFRSAIHSTTVGYTRTNYELGRTLLALGRPRQAIAVLKPALHGPLDGSSLYLSRTEIHEMLGYSFEAAGEPDSAMTYFTRTQAAWRRADPELHARRGAIIAALRTPR